MTCGLSGSHIIDSIRCKGRTTNIIQEEKFMFKKLRQKAKNKKGFTLVELIVVIVIILVLAAVLVPSLLRYVDKANKANCKADAATILSQLQADYAASQANEQTGVSALGDDYKVNGVEVLNRAATVAAPANKAVYTVTAVADSSAGAQTYNEITRFAYNNGKYTATWNMNGGTGVTAGWTVTKN